MTTRAELEADIAGFVSMQSSLIDLQEACDFPVFLGLEIELIDRAIARLCRDLAKLDGPAEGFVRHWYVDDGMTGAIRCSRDRAKREAATYVNGFVFFVDLPIRTVSVIEGEVCDG